MDQAGAISSGIWVARVAERATSGGMRIEREAILRGIMVQEGTRMRWESGIDLSCVGEYMEWKSREWRVREEVL